MDKKKKKEDKKKPQPRDFNVLAHQIVEESTKESSRSPKDSDKKK